MHGGCNQKGQVPVQLYQHPWPTTISQPPSGGSLCAILYAFLSDRDLTIWPGRSHWQLLHCCKFWQSGCVSTTRARAVGCHGGFWAEFLIQGAALPVALALRPGILENLKLCTTWDQAWMVTLFMLGRMRLNIFSVDYIWRIHDSMITDHSSDSGSCHAGLLDFTMIIIS